MVQSEIKSVKIKEIPWPSSPQNVSQQSLGTVVPLILFNLLAWFILGINENKKSSFHRTPCESARGSRKANTCQCAKAYGIICLSTSFGRQHGTWINTKPL